MKRLMKTIMLFTFSLFLFECIPISSVLAKTNKKGNEIRTTTIKIQCNDTSGKSLNGKDFDYGVKFHTIRYEVDVPRGGTTVDLRAVLRDEDLYPGSKKWSFSKFKVRKEYRYSSGRLTLRWADDCFDSSYNIIAHFSKEKEDEEDSKPSEPSKPEEPIKPEKPKDDDNLGSKPQNPGESKSRAYIQCIPYDESGNCLVGKVSSNGYKFKQTSVEEAVPDEGTYVDLSSAIAREIGNYKFVKVSPVSSLAVKGSSVHVKPRYDTSNPAEVKLIYKFTGAVDKSKAYIQCIPCDSKGNSLVGKTTSNGYKFVQTSVEESVPPEGKYVDLSGAIAREIGNYEFSKIEPISHIAVHGTQVHVKSNYNASNPAKVKLIYQSKDEATSGGKGYYRAHYMQKDESGKVTPIEDMGSAGTADGSLELGKDGFRLLELQHFNLTMLSEKGWKIVSFTATNCEKDNYTSKLYLSKKNTKDNRADVIVICQKSSDITYIERHVVIDAKGNVQDTLSQKSYVAPYGKKMTFSMSPSYEKQGLVYKSSYMRASASSDAPNLAEGKRSITYDGKAPKGVRTLYVSHFYEGGTPVKDILFHVIDNFIDKDGKAMKGENGYDYLEKRSEVPYLNNPPKSVFPMTFTSNFGPGLNKEYNGMSLTLEKVIIQKHQYGSTTIGNGNVDSAYKEEGSKVWKTFSNSATFNDLSGYQGTYYVHFFWRVDTEASLIIHHKDIDTKETIASYDEIKVKVGQKIKGAEVCKDIDGYVYVTSNPIEITIKPGVNNIDCFYKKGECYLVVKHIGHDNGSDTTLDIQTYYDIKVGQEILGSTYRENFEGWKFDKSDPSHLTIKKGKNEIILHYDKKKEDEPVPGGPGEIKFNPDHCAWTNEGRKENGVGAYGVDVWYEGEYLKTNSATCHWKTWVPPHCSTKNGKEHCTKGHWSPHSKSYTTWWEMKHIRIDPTNTTVSPTTVSGTKGRFYITEENKYIKLDGTGVWKSKPHHDDCDDHPSKHVKDNEPQPDEPKGHAEYYFIDWSDPVIDLDDPIRRPEKPDKCQWQKEPRKYIVNATITDNLSGIKEGIVTITDHSHYGKNKSIPIKYECSDPGSGAGQLKIPITMEFDDGMYTIDIYVKDVAGNEHRVTKSIYLVDFTDPECEFDIKPGIFGQVEGAERKPSVHTPPVAPDENDSFYGKLTFWDNLSGVMKVETGWTFEDEKWDTKWETAWSSEYTYNDRYQQKDTIQVEKPVGDVLYLHVRLTDTALNVKEFTFGPYDDPIKLKNFGVTDIRDPQWKDVFYDKGVNDKVNGTRYQADKLPIDNASNPIYTNSYPKIGYSFYFDITSEYLYREKDHIVIKPTFFVRDSRVQLDAYYDKTNKGDNKKLMKIDEKSNVLKLHMNRSGSSCNIGDISKLDLHKNVRVCKGKEWLGEDGWKQKHPGDVQYYHGKDQYWYAKYLLPASTVFVEKGKKPYPYNIVKDDIVINFEIVGYKNGVETNSSDQIFRYLNKQWAKEGGPKGKPYEVGDVMVYPWNKNALLDFKSNLIH